MREFTLKLIGVLGVLLPVVGNSQVTFRSTHLALANEKTTSVTAEVPCEGTTILAEDFEAGIPSSWTVIDGDGLQPRAQMNLLPGWQSRQDYRDTSNLLAVSPSWYFPAAQSDDWLITPQVTLGNNPCLSWWVYSQDQYFKEAYEVLVSTTLDTAAFKANAAVETVVAESGTPHTATASLANWAGQTVYIAFHQTSNDKFALAIDDVKLTNVNALDIGVYSFTYGSPDPGDTVTFRFEVANYGSDTITSFDCIYSVEGGPQKTMNVGPVSIPPNGTLFFNHDITYLSDSLDAFHAICAWTNLPNGAQDEEVHNDSLCSQFAVGSPVGTPEPTPATVQMELYPNPCADEISVRFSSQSLAKIDLQVVDARGALVASMVGVKVAGGVLKLPTGDWKPGLYFLTLRPEGKPIVSQKILKL